jgi:hypothetical protein
MAQDGFGTEANAAEQLAASQNYSPASPINDVGGDSPSRRRPPSARASSLARAMASVSPHAWQGKLPSASLTSPKVPARRSVQASAAREHVIFTLAPRHAPSRRCPSVPSPARRASTAPPRRQGAAGPGAGRLHGTHGACLAARRQVGAGPARDAPHSDGGLFPQFRYRPSPAHAGSRSFQQVSRCDAGRPTVAVRPVDTGRLEPEIPHRPPPHRSSAHLAVRPTAPTRSPHPPPSPRTQPSATPCRAEPLGWRGGEAKADGAAAGESEPIFCPPRCRPAGRREPETVHRGAPHRPHRPPHRPPHPR